MKRTNKHGFTLIEMLLAIAITLIISGLFISLIVAIRASYYRTYNDDDCADIAAMYAEALENQILLDIQNNEDDEISIGADGILTNTNTNHPIGFDMIDNFNRASTNQKWLIRMICYYNSDTNEFRYQFFFVDKYVNPGYLHYVYEGSFWIPYYAPFQNHTLGSGDEYDLAGGGNYDWDYNVGSISDTGFSITITPTTTQNVSGDLITTMEGGYYTRYANDGMGNMGVVTGTNTGEIPTTSATVTITNS
ncbi:MAG: type II secretion system protein [Clostridiales bacterium]|nr:type II secretion system protein [Clostridiales bacterium]